MSEKINLFEATKPCGNCPYRKDAPLKLWDKYEFEKLLQTENQQFGSVYKCHKDNGGVCVGWLMKQKENGCPSISLRISLIKAGDIGSYLDSLSSPSPLYKNVKAMIRANYPSVVKKLNVEQNVHGSVATGLNQGTNADNQIKQNPFGG